MNKSLPITLSFAIGLGNGIHPDIPHLPHTDSVDLFTTSPITAAVSTTATTVMIGLWSTPGSI
jgi:hypothetical protein